MGPHPRPDCGEAQIPGGWAVQLESSKNEQEFYLESSKNKQEFCHELPRLTERKRNDSLRIVQSGKVSPRWRSQQGETLKFDRRTVVLDSWTISRFPRTYVHISLKS